MNFLIRARLVCVALGVVLTTPFPGVASFARTTIVLDNFVDRTVSIYFPFTHFFESKIDTLI